MTENYERSGVLKELALEVINEYTDLRYIIQMGISFDCVMSQKEKTSKGRVVLGECIKVRELYQAYIPYEFLIVIYGPNIAHLNDNQKKILLYHELLHIGFTEKDGEIKYKVNPHDVEEFDMILKRYGADWTG